MRGKALGTTLYRLCLCCCWHEAGQASALLQCWTVLQLLLPAKWEWRLAMQGELMMHEALQK